MALFIKPANEDIGAIMDDVVLELVYGASKHPPGSPKSVAQLLVQKVEEAIKEKEEEEAARRAERGEQEEPLLPSEEGVSGKLRNYQFLISIFCRKQRNHLYLGTSE